MQVRFDLPPQIDSPLARLDGRWRLVSLLSWIVCSAIVATVLGSLLTLGASLVVALLARLDWRWAWRRFRIVAWLIVVFALPLPWLAEDGTRFACLLTLKAVSLFVWTSVLLVTAPLEVTLKSARALWIPGLLIQLTLLSYRYLFLIGDELTRLRIALRARGFRNRANLRSYHVVAAAAGTLLVRTHDRAERVAAAMRCRGFDGTFRALGDFRTTRRDVAFAGFSLGSAVGIVILDLLWQR